MALLFFEALLALALLLFIVWWTMFSGRRNGEPQNATGVEDSSLESTRSDGSQSRSDAGRASIAVTSLDKPDTRRPQE